MKAVLEHYKIYSVNVWAPYNQKRDLDELDGGNIEVKRAGNCNGWDILGAVFPERAVLALVRFSRRHGRKL